MPGTSEQNGQVEAMPWIDPGDAPPRDAVPEAMFLNQRVRLIERLVAEAIDDPSPVAANLKANGGDLLEMTLRLKPQIMALLRSSTSAEELRELQPFLETYVKLGRQADRFLRLGQEIAHAESGRALRKRSP